MADFATRSLGVGYPGGSLILFACLMSELAFWYWSLSSISVETVSTPNVEAFYWAAITFSETLGTLSVTGSPTQGSDIKGARWRSLPAWRCSQRPITGPTYRWYCCFGAAFILTRPLGATVGDYIDEPLDKRGLDLSRPLTTAVVAALMILCILVFPQRAGNHPRRA